MRRWLRVKYYPFVWFLLTIRSVPFSLPISICIWMNFFNGYLFSLTLNGYAINLYLLALINLYSPQFHIPLFALSNASYFSSIFHFYLRSPTNGYWNLITTTTTWYLIFILGRIRSELETQESLRWCTNTKNRVSFPGSTGKYSSFCLPVSDNPLRRLSFPGK